MRHRREKVVLSRKKGPREAMLRNLAQSVLLYENVNTTLAKAKAVRAWVEKIITLGQKKDLNARRQLARILTVESAIRKVLEELGPRYADKPSGRLRIIKLGFRKGDGAEMVQLQLIKSASAQTEVPVEADHKSK